MNTKKAFFDLTGLLMVIVIISVILLILITNNLFFAKPTFERNSQNPALSEEINPSEYNSILKHAERTVDSFKSQIPRQEKLLNY